MYPERVVPLLDPEIKSKKKKRKKEKKKEKNWPTARSC